MASERITTTTTTITSILATVTNTVTSVLTLAATSTQVESSTITSIETSTLTTTVDTSTITLTTSLQLPFNQKRSDLIAKQKRALSPCSTTLTSPVSVPRHASACSGTSRYSSACSCIGVTESTTTLSAQMTTVTETSVASSTARTETTLTSTQLDPITSTATVPTTVTATSEVTISVTRTITATETVGLPTPSVEGDNRGMEWPFYENRGDRGFLHRCDDATCGNSKPEAFAASRSVEYAGVTTNIGYEDPISGGDRSFYESPPTLRRNYNVFNHRGYVYAQHPGTYQYILADIDDVAFVWTGAKAYRGWTGDNYDLKVFLRTGSFTFEVGHLPGTYKPFRVMLANTVSAASFTFQVRAPDGSLLVSKSSDTTLVVRYSCDGVGGPLFPPFGSET